MINLTNKKINIVSISSIYDHDKIIHDIDHDIYLKVINTIDIQSCVVLINHEINESFIQNEIKINNLNYNLYFSDQNFKKDDNEVYLCSHSLINFKELLPSNFYIIKDFYLIDNEYYVLQFI